MTHFPNSYTVTVKNITDLVGMRSDVSHVEIIKWGPQSFSSYIFRIFRTRSYELNFFYKYFNLKTYKNLNQCLFQEIFVWRTENWLFKSVSLWQPFCLHFYCEIFGQHLKIKASKIDADVLKLTVILNRHLNASPVFNNTQ